MTYEPASGEPEDGEAHQAAVAIELCGPSHLRLMAAVRDVDDETARRPSLLPGWSVGHVLTHLARNADGHVRRLEGALRGEDIARYPGGKSQRDGEIEEGALRPAGTLAEDVARSAQRLEEVWSRCQALGWPNWHLLGDDHWPTTASPLRRLREVEVHHVDLGLGYRATDWPEEYVQWELPLVLEQLPQRLGRPEDARRLLAWLIGRAEAVEGLELDPW
jgi:maleylpyruvate isomerase